MTDFFTQWELWVSLAFAIGILTFALPPLLRWAEASGRRTRERIDAEHTADKD